MIIEVGKNYDVMTLLRSALMEARRLVPNSTKDCFHLPRRHFQALCRLLFSLVNKTLPALRATCKL